MRSTVSRKRAKKIQPLGVKVDKFKPIVVKNDNRKKMSGDNNGQNFNR